MNKLLRLFSGLISAGGVLWCVYVLWQYNISAVVAAVATVVAIVAFALTWVKTEIAVAMAFAASVTLILEFAELIEYKLVFPHLQVPIAMASALLVAASAMIFVSARCWQRENGKRYRPALTALIWLLLIVLPLFTFVYRTIDVDHVKVTATLDADEAFAMRLYKGKSQVVITNRGDAYDRTSRNNVLMGLKRTDTLQWQCYDCKLRMCLLFGKVKNIELIRNNETGEYFDDNKTHISVPLRSGNGVLEIDERMLRW